MINRKQAKKYCCEKISLIENYDKAKMDLLETWHLHHRKEDDGYSVKDLVDLGLYYDRPANELIFLTKSEHASLHNKGEKNYWYGKTGENHPMYGRIGEKNHMYGRTGEKNHKSKPVYQIDKNTGEIIKIWTCTMEVQRQLGIDNSLISLCCTGKHKSAGGFVWRYDNESGGD